MLAYYNVPHTKSDFISRGGLREWLERHVLSYLQRYHWAGSNLGSDPMYFFLIKAEPALPLMFIFRRELSVELSGRRFRNFPKSIAVMFLKTC